MIYFTSDLHFFHSRIIAYAKRPFQSVEEMDCQLIRKWNARVSPDDEIYILGDLTLKGPQYANQILEQLQGRKYLLRGNHDFFADRASFRRDALVWVRDYCELEYQGLSFILCHYPLACWNGIREGAFQLHGHMHHSRAYNLRNRDGGVRQFDVGVDANGMAPVSIRELLDFWTEANPLVPEAPLDGHALPMQNHHAPQESGPV